MPTEPKLLTTEELAAYRADLAEYRTEESELGQRRWINDCVEELLCHIAAQEARIRELEGQNALLLAGHKPKPEPEGWTST